MKETLQEGIGNEMDVQVSEEMGIRHMNPSVLSTPAMIGIMEQTCLESLNPYLDENEQSVGTMVHVWHRAAVPVGGTVHSTSRIIERDRRRVLFEVKVTQGDKVIGDGTHERFIIDTSRFGRS